MFNKILAVKTVVRLVDLAAIAAMTFALSIYFYHPYYFGDEMFSFNFGEHSGNTLMGVFTGLNSYKPRIVMNFIWAVIVSQDLPRWMTMLVNCAALAGCAALVYGIARVHFNARRSAALLAAAMMVACRFNIMLYFDYVSGTVEALSLLFLLAGVAVSMPGLVFLQRQRASCLALALLLFILAVFTHERYALALLGLSGVAVLRWWPMRRSVGARPLVFALVTAVAPLGLYIVAVKVLSNQPVAMGTSGQTVSVSLDTAKVAATYLVNLFLGGNHGPQYFVGMFNHAAPRYMYLFVPLASVSLLAWCLPWLRPQWRSTTYFMPMLAFLAAIVGLVAIASLPGSARQEARWMYPAMAFLLLFVFAGYRHRAQIVILSVLAVTQLFYLFFGSMWSIASITGARLAVSISDSLSTLRQDGDGVVVAGPEPDISWVLGEDGKVYCRLNLPKGHCLYPRAEFSKGNVKEFSYGLVVGEPNLRGRPGFSVISAEQAKRLMDPAALPAPTHQLGEGKEWPEWMGIPDERVSSEGLELRGLSEVTRRQAAEELDRHIVLYTAQSADGQPGRMRLQINWHGADGGFISTQIEVVDVGLVPRSYPLLAVAPSGATHAYVYATLPDDHSGRVLLRNIGVANP
ncbi:hypothetical protein J5H37_14245 [Stenotrophomonas maltophilia]|uniref:hypothetical protein n=1 Tax=Stenotrophomonas TaxID=40323 RepID=UPI0006AC8098|nr:MULTISPECIES: hypothetical protein [Stenotrophomonas]KOQ66426.1 hypothetical protein ABW42_06060 [Stenotrophomonas maltophilia]MBN7829856.1 hypothetical protein [Stenotrophomonas maltophilia]MBN7833942.1 hypothetical protein [Stenotrophomonas maltophilia]MBN7857907.1 hypothetical protein [Stenotrophomonas maltophilia]MBN7917756.1 hypothetical protein [Stenotrophomonas maltophilia]